MSNKKSSSSKSKKSKSDLFRACIGFYLKHNRYVPSERFRRSDILLQQNKKEFAVQKMMETDLHGGNSFSYSNVLCITNNQQIVEQQFGRFAQFVDSQVDTVRTELKRFYGPMLCHLYLELLKAREPKAAGDLLKKYAHLLAVVDLYEAPMPTKINGCSVANDAHTDSTVAATPCNIRFMSDANSADDPELDYFIRLLETLSTCTKFETAESNAEVAHFRSSKYELHTTANVIRALCSYFEKCGHVLILNLIYTWFHVNVIDNEVHQLSEDYLFFGPEEDDTSVQDHQQNQNLPVINYNRSPLTMPPPGTASLTIPSTPTVTATVTSLAAQQQVVPVSKTGCDKPVKRSIEESTDAKQVKVEPDSSAETLRTTDEDKRAKIERNLVICQKTMRMSKLAILKSQMDLPRFVRIGDRTKGLTSAHIDSNECHMVAGFNDATVKLWQLNHQTCKGKNLYRRIEESTCPWELNNCFKEDNQIDHDFQTHLRTESYHSTQLQQKFYESKYEENSYNDFGGIYLRGHGMGVTDVRFSYNYPLLYSVSKDSTMRCWRAESYTCAAIYRGHRYPIWCIDESPAGMYVATGSKDLTARLWSLEKQFPLITYAGHTQDVECLAFHPNGNYIATGSADLSVRLWCVTSGKLMRVFSECKQAVCTVEFSPDGKMLAAAGEETKIRIFDLAAGTQLHELKDNSATVTSMAWSENGQHLAAVCHDGSLRMWDVKKLTPTHEDNCSSSASNMSASSTTSTSISSAGTTYSRFMMIQSKNRSFVKVFYTANQTVCCIGS